MSNQKGRKWESGQIGPINDAREREKSGNSLTTGNGSVSQVSPWLPTLSFTNIDKQNYILKEEKEEMTCDVWDDGEMRAPIDGNE